MLGGSKECCGDITVILGCVWSREPGGVANHFVTQMLRQSDLQVSKRYGQAKLNMMREAMAKRGRNANVHEAILRTARPS
jgi:hypothetical protein